MENVIWQWQWTCLKADYEMNPGGRCRRGQEDTDGTDLENIRRFGWGGRCLMASSASAWGPKWCAVET